VNRWVIPIVLAVTVFVHYIDRNNLAIALPQIAQEFGWSDREIGARGNLLLGAFYLTFGLAQVALSPFAERFGVKRSLVLSVLGFSVCAILVYPLGGSLAGLIALRLMLGVAESVHMPMNSALVSRWFPPHERGRANSVYVAGILIALALAPWLIIPVVERFGWRLGFALLGLAGLAIALPLVLVFINDRPPSWQPAPPSQQVRFARQGWLWLYITAGAFNAFCVFGVLNWLPTYLNRTKGIEFGALSLPLFLVFVAGIVGVFLWAFLGDRTGRRIALASGGLFIAGWMVLATGWVQNSTLVVMLFALGVFFQSAYNAQEFATLQRMLPQGQVGAGTGLYNGLTVLIGGVGGSLIPGTIVSLTSSFQAGILSVVVGAWLVAGLMALLGKRLGGELNGRFDEVEPHAG